MERNDALKTLLIRADELPAETLLDISARICQDENCKHEKCRPEAWHGIPAPNPFAEVRRNMDNGITRIAWGAVS